MLDLSSKPRVGSSPVEDATEACRAIEELKRAEKEWRELDQRKNEFLAAIAHELRNPLAPLRNGLEVLRLAGGGGEVGEKARAMMDRQLRRMVRLVDDLLDVSRVSRDKIELAREACELAAVLGSAIEASQPRMIGRRHQFKANIPPQRIVLDADARRLAQVFSNLLDNAAKYTPDGGHIVLSVAASEGEVAVSVRDNGVGIPADMLGRVFDIFTPVDRALEKKAGGLGIGLSIAKRLVDMHGGRIEVKSAGPGQGSEFTVRLPATVEDVAPGATARRRILVADDNEDAAITLSMLLEAFGNEVRVAHNGEQAVRTAEDFRPDAILMDIGMPRLDGYQACERIRLAQAGQGPMIVALTGWDGEEDKDRARAAGFDRHMVKPIDPAALEKLAAEIPLLPR